MKRSAIIIQSFIFLIVMLIPFNAAIAAGGHKGRGNSRIGLDIGVAYDMDLGVTAQIKRYTLFFNGDAFAFDIRMQNFYNNRKTLHLYIDAGGFVDPNNGNKDNDRAGLRLPIGLDFGLERNLEVFIQAVPFIDFSNDANFDVDAALGIRIRI